MFLKLTHFLSIIFICYASQLTAQQSDVVSVAVVDFEQSGISELEVQTLTQRFSSELQNTAKAILVDRDVLISQIASAGYSPSSCKAVECVLKAIGDTLGVQYIITGSVKKNKKRYTLNAVFTNVATGSEEQIIKTNYNGPVDGMVVELEIMAWNIMNQTPPESLFAKRKGKTRTRVRRPNVKTSLGALARASVIPGWGHYYADQSGRGLMFYSAEVVALSLGYLAYLDYDRAYGKVDLYFKKYKAETDEELLQYYKGKTQEAEDAMIRKNNTLITMFRAAAAIHALNMVDAYMLDITPEPFGKKTTLGLGFDPIISQPQLRFSIALD